MTPALMMVKSCGIGRQAGGAWPEYQKRRPWAEGPILPGKWVMDQTGRG